MGRLLEDGRDVTTGSKYREALRKNEEREEEAVKRAEEESRESLQRWFLSQRRAHLWFAGCMSTPTGAPRNFACRVAVAKSGAKSKAKVKDIPAPIVFVTEPEFRFMIEGKVAPPASGASGGAAGAASGGAGVDADGDEIINLVSPRESSAAGGAASSSSSASSGGSYAASHHGHIVNPAPGTGGSTLWVDVYAPRSFEDLVSFAIVHAQ